MKIKNISAGYIAAIVSSKSWGVQSLGHIVGRSEGGGGWSADVGQDPVGFLSYGPYEGGLSQGKWTASWSLYIKNSIPESVKVARIEVCDFDGGGQILASKEITGQQFVLPNQPQNFRLYLC
jgi:hypothetical protein